MTTAGGPISKRRSALSPIVVRCADRGATIHRYRLAATDLLADMPLPCLAPFENRPLGVEPTGGRRSLADDRLPADGAVWPVRFDEVVWLGGARRRLVCRGRGDRLRLSVDGAPAVIVDTGAARIECDGAPVAGEAATRVLDLVTGPALALALAGRGIFCLHASAVALRGRAHLFFGASGAGKSTLAASPPAGAERIADDILPVTVGGHGARALLPFPQLKLGAAEQAGRSGAHELRIAAAVLLESGEPGHGGLLEVKRLGPADAALALARHTVAAKLFAPDLLARHLDACADLAAAVPVHAAAFRRDRRRLGALRAALLAPELAAS